MQNSVEDYQISKNFNTKELRCKCGCNSLVYDVAFIEKLQALRDAVGFPLTITSYYRCDKHPEEVKKEKPGMHNTALAVDLLKPAGPDGFKLLAEAIRLGFTGIGVSNKFIHLDLRNTPALWGY